MAKMRVNELAKKMNISNKELIAFLNDNNIASVTSHANNISDEEADKAISLYNKSKAVDTKKDADTKENKNEKKFDKELADKENKKDTNVKADIKGTDNKPVSHKDKDNSHNPAPQKVKQKFVMKVNTQNISNKNYLERITGKQARLDKRRNNEQDAIRQEIIERQKKIEEYKRLHEQKEREQQKSIDEKRKQLDIKTDNNNNKSIKDIKDINKNNQILQKESNTEIKAETITIKDNNEHKNADTNKSNVMGVSSTQVMEQRKDSRQQINKQRQKDNRAFDNRTAGNDRQPREPKKQEFGNNQKKDVKKPFKQRENQGRNNFADRRFDKDKDEDTRNVRRERPRNEKKSSNSDIAVVLDTRSKKTKDKRDKENKNKDKRRDRTEKLERNFSLERTSKRTHKQALRDKQAMQAAELSKDQEKVAEITIPDFISIKDLAEKMKITAAALIKELFLKGQVVTLNQEIDFDTAEEIAMEHDILCELEEKVNVIEELLKEEEEDESDLVKRPPVVCVMGHVDHGKTSLLDAIRNTHVIDKESGGITQHIGAYVVKANGQKITFLDTPGHEAFTAMRMRGAGSTDIAILVVAADDGVMPQTIEAINHAKAANVEIIVAINKMDKPSANIDKVKQELADQGLIPEDWGGSHIFVPVSAKTGAGLDDLLEMILLTAEVAELKANPNRKARGLVLEAKLDKGRGSVANILIQKGTLHVGDFISAGHCSGKVRAMIDDKGRKIKEASVSTPVEILGLNNVPNAGEILIAHDTDKDAKNFAATFVSEGREKLLEDTKTKMSLDDLFEKIREGNLKEFSIVVKADVQGSAEAIKQSLEKLSNDEVVVKIIHSGVGAINESDVILASASNAIIIGFNVRPDAQAKNVAEAEGVDIRLYSVIYQAIEDVEAAMKGLLDPVYEEEIIGHAEIRQIFKASDIGNIAGSYVLDGRFERDCKVRISRGEEQIFEGKLASLKRFKDDVKEVKAGFECGLVFEGFNDIAELDTVEAYKMVEVKR